MSSQYNDEDEGGGGHGATLDLSRDGSLGGSGTNGLLREIPSPPRITRDSSAYPPSLTVYHETASQTYVDEDRHVHFMALKEPEIPVTWRLKERMKVGSSKQAVAHAGCVSLTAGWPLAAVLQTVSVALVLCLNIGTDPPDVVKTSPCARKECWFDPRTTSKQKATETIGNNLQQQYERWQVGASRQPLHGPA